MYTISVDSCEKSPAACQHHDEVVKDSTVHWQMSDNYFALAHSPLENTIETLN